MVKYLAENSYVPFITVFLNKFLDNKPKGFPIDDSDDIDRDLDTELELLTMTNALTMDMMPEIDRFYITLQFELAKAMSSCIIFTSIYYKFQFLQISQSKKICGTQTSWISIQPCFSRMSMQHLTKSRRKIHKIWTCNNKMLHL